MSVILINTAPGAANGAAKPHGFWQRLARALDELAVCRTRRAVPEMALRRSKHDINRYRRLMLKSAMAPVGARIGRANRAAPHR